MRKRFFLIVVAIFLMFGTSNLHAKIIDFEDLYPNPPAATVGGIPTNYEGFHWGGNENWATYDFQGPTTGWAIGTKDKVSSYTDASLVISLPNLSEQFDFYGAYITSANLSQLTVTVKGYRSGILNPVFSETFETYNNQAIWFSFNFLDIDELVIAPLGNHIIIDNLDVVMTGNVPIPGAAFLLGSGLVGLLVFRRRK